jgi:hypothetical protein
MKRNLLIFVISVLLIPSVASAKWDWPWNAGKDKERAEQAERERDQARGRANTAQQQAASAKHQASAAIFWLCVVAVVAGGTVWYFYSRRVVRTPAHSIIDDAYVIDGLNVARSYAPNKPASLPVLLTLLSALRQRGWTFKCFFDANSRYVFHDEAGADHMDAYDALCRDYPDNFVQVPGRTQADREILAYAHSRGTRIISNDRFREYAQVYPWIEREPQRRITGIAHSGFVHVTPLGIEASIPNDLSEIVSSIRDLLEPRITQSA